MLPTIFNPATEMPKKSNRYRPANAKSIRAKAAVNTALMAVALRSFLVRPDVMVRKTGMVPMGFISVKKEVK